METEYYIDKISISSHQYASALKEKLPVKELRNKAESFSIRNLKDDRAWYYNSAIDIALPDKQCLELLVKRNIAFAPYKISYIELARDKYHQSEYEAELAVSRLSKTFRKKYSGSKNYDGREKEKNPQKGLVGDSTHYYGSVSVDEEGNTIIGGKFRYAIYRKDSPINGLPCVHEEWRIQSAGKIFSKTGIKTIGDVLEINQAEVFDKLTAAYIKHQRINKRKLGAFLHTLEGKKFSSDNKMGAGLYGMLFCKVYKIKTASDLCTKIKCEKIRLKSKAGRKTAWQRGILKMNCAQFFDSSPASL